MPTKPKAPKCLCGKWEWDGESTVPGWFCRHGRGWLRAWWTRGTCEVCRTLMLPDGKTKEPTHA